MGIIFFEIFFKDGSFLSFIYRGIEDEVLIYFVYLVILLVFLI